MSTTRNLTLAAASVAAGALLYRACRTSDYSFRDRVVLITGGSRGLGLVIARELAAEGARLAILARDAGEVERAVQDLGARGAETLGITCDVRLENDLQSAVERIISRFGRIDVLINNAGVIQVGPLHHMHTTDFEEAMAVHFWGPLHCIQCVLPHMRARGEGRIVNISSIGGRIGVPHLAPYCASKFALTGLSESLRAELAEEQILVTTVCPGLMRTGSPPNAFFKGRHQEEYTWFALSDAMPLLSMSAVRAARKVLEACRHGDAMVTLSLPAKLAVLLHTVAPNVFEGGMALMNQLLPQPSLERGTESYSGWESQSRWAPSVLTRLSDRATEENNEGVVRRGS